MEMRMQDRGEVDFTDLSPESRPAQSHMRTRNFEPDTSNLKPYETVRAEYLQKMAREHQTGTSLTAEAAANAQIRKQAEQTATYVQPDYLAGQVTQYRKPDYLAGQGMQQTHLFTEETQSKHEPGTWDSE